MDIEWTVFVIDEDPRTAEAVENIIHSLGNGRCVAFTSGLEFLDQYDGSLPGCVITELRMMATSGLQIQNRLLARGHEIPIIFATSDPDVPTVVNVMRSGAVNLLEKPLEGQTLWQAIQEAVELSRKRLVARRHRKEVRAQFASLTPREKQVFTLIGQEMDQSDVASELGVAGRTVETYCARLKAKFDVESILELQRLASEISGNNKRGVPVGNTAPFVDNTVHESPRYASRDDFLEIPTLLGDRS